jgi:hypothetical protein
VFNSPSGTTTLTTIGATTIIIITGIGAGAFITITTIITTTGVGDGAARRQARNRRSTEHRFFHC